MSSPRNEREANDALWQRARDRKVVRLHPLNRIERRHVGQRVVGWAVLIALAAGLGVLLAWRG